MLPLKSMSATRQREMRELLASLERDFERLRDARHHDPHSILGRHEHAGREIVIVYLPGAAVDAHVRAEARAVPGEFTRRFAPVP